MTLHLIPFASDLAMRELYSNIDDKRLDLAGSFTTEEEATNA